MEDDPKSAAMKARYHPQTERLMRQFLSTDGPKGASKEFQRGWVFNFEFTQEQRDVVNKLMEYGMSFDEAFDYYVALPEAQKAAK